MSSDKSKNLDFSALDAEDLLVLKPTEIFDLRKPKSKRKGNTKRKCRKKSLPKKPTISEELLSKQTSEEVLYPDHVQAQSIPKARDVFGRYEKLLDRAKGEGRIDGKFRCTFCGMRYHNQAEMSECCLGL